MIECPPHKFTVDHLLIENRRFPPFANIQEKAFINSQEQYLQMYNRSIESSSEFWLEQAKSLDWYQAPTEACNFLWDSNNNDVWHTWFADGSLNVSVNCLDRHLKSKRNKTAIIWQGDRDDEYKEITYGELHSLVCRFANVLKELGVAKGDRVCLYLPSIPEGYVAMLACARIGAIHSVVFGGFSAESLAHRIQDAGCKFLVTADVLMRGGKRILLKNIADRALESCDGIEKVVVVRREQDACSMHPLRDICYHEVMAKASEICTPAILQAEDPLFILYTSGSTGKPKGVVHTQAGYLLHAALTHKYVFDVHENDIYWCTADVGWITGHSYGVYGPLANGATTLMFEGIPTFPDPGRYWQIIDKFKVSVFYTAPTAIRALIAQGTEWSSKYNLNSLRILGTVGEPINPEAWVWYFENVGHSSCPVVDTWWQTETGGIMITPLPGYSTLKPGSAARPFFGVEPIVLQDDAKECPKNEGGSLCIRRPWPGIMRTTWGNHQLFIDTYFKTFKNLYFTGDGCRIDEDGDYWLLGRIDDVVNVSGHRIGTAEVESALVSHPDVAEAAVVPMPHKIKGQGLKAYVVLNNDVVASNGLRKQLLAHVRNEIGAIAVPDEIQFTPLLPKTRSGKIMRRVLRKIAEGEYDQLGDISTLADPQAIQVLLPKENLF